MLRVVCCARANSVSAWVVAVGSCTECTLRAANPNRSGGPTSVGAAKPANRVPQAVWAASTSWPASQATNPRYGPAATGAGRHSWRRFPAAGSAATSHRARCGGWSPPADSARRRTNQHRPQRALLSQIGDRSTLGGADRLDALLEVRAVTGGQVDKPPRYYRISHNHLHRLVSCSSTNRAPRLRMTGDHVCTASCRRC